MFAPIVRERTLRLYKALDELYKSVVVYQGSENVTETRPFCGRGKALFHAFALFISRCLKESALFFPCKSTFSERGLRNDSSCIGIQRVVWRGKTKTSALSSKCVCRACNSASYVVPHVVSRSPPLRRTRMEDDRLARDVACNWKLVISRQMLVINPQGAASRLTYGRLNTIDNNRHCIPTSITHKFWSNLFHNPLQSCFPLSSI